MDFGRPACFRTAFAVCRLTMPCGTVKCLPVSGENQSSWLPLAGRT